MKDIDIRCSIYDQLRSLAGLDSEQGGFLLLEKASGKLTGTEFVHATDFQPYATQEFIEIQSEDYFNAIYKYFGQCPHKRHLMFWHTHPYESIHDSEDYGQLTKFCNEEFAHNIELRDKVLGEYPQFYKGIKWAARPSEDDIAAFKIVHRLGKKRNLDISCGIATTAEVGAWRKRFFGIERMNLFVEGEYMKPLEPPPDNTLRIAIKVNRETMDVGFRVKELDA